MPIAYIAGPITGVENFKPKFNRAANMLRDAGWQVLNPVELPTGMTESAYMDICLAMVRHCDAIVMLPDWEGSTGAVCERALATKMGKPCFYDVIDVTAVVL